MIYEYPTYPITDYGDDRGALVSLERDKNIDFELDVYITYLIQKKGSSEAIMRQKFETASYRC